MKQNYTHIAVVLDRSGSMSSIADDTIGGVNEFFKTQKEAPGECSATLVQFDDAIESVFENKPVRDWKPLTAKTYQPRNSTALYDAVGKTINDTGNFLSKMDEKDKPVICVIVTDGFENASRRFTQKQIFDMITHQRDQYQWEFVFIGANQDAYAAGASIGIGASHTINYAANTKGTQSLYASAGANVLRARCFVAAGGQSVDTMSWSDEDRKKQAEAGAQE